MDIKSNGKTLLIFLLFCLFSLSATAETDKPLMDSKTIVWAGLDYSLTRFIGSDKSDALYNFVPNNLKFPKTLEKWNQLFLNERIEGVSKSLGKEVLIDLSGVIDRNNTASTNQVILTDNIAETCNELNVSTMDIFKEVKSYKMETTNGLGLVFIVDKLVVASYPSNPAYHIRSFGSVFMVFFDISTRDVLSIELETNPISTGGNFYTFWFGPIKDADDALIRHKPSKAAVEFVPFNPNAHNGRSH